MPVKALVVDNNPVLLRAVSALLAQEGCIVHTADTGLAALEGIDEFAPDIVFTDLIMPMVGGEQLCRILRNTPKHQNIYIVVLSAIVLEERERIVREIPCDICIAKGNLLEMRHHLQTALQAYHGRHIPTSPAGGRTAAHIPDGLKPSETTSELLVEKRHLTALLDNLEEGIIELNYQGKVVTVNGAALNILSCREEHIIGMPLYMAIDWAPFNEAIKMWTEQQLLAGGGEKYTIMEDSPLYLNELVLTASFIVIAEEKTFFGLCILKDITRQHAAEKHQREMDNALKLVKKMDAMSCMAGGFAHDFNNLLTVLCGNLDILSLHGESRSGEQRNKLLQQAKQAALVAIDLTRQISCFSSFGIVRREKVPLESLINDTLADFFEGDRDRYRMRVAAAHSLIHGDPQELSQAVCRVVQNAVEASAGQRLEVVIGEDDFATPQLLAGQYVPAGKYCRIDFCDSGRGIHPEQLLQIFDPYYSTKQRGVDKGMGLGLTLVYAILRNHGGCVVVNSEHGRGTTVSFYLPAMADEQTSSSTTGVASVKDRSVLLIEPDQQMVAIGKIMLGYLGFSVIAVSDRAGAVDALHNFNFAGTGQLPPSLVILALEDENEASAVQTCRILHTINANLKIIAMSGMILDPVMQNCREYGFVNALPKPFSMDSLKHIMNTVLAL